MRQALRLLVAFVVCCTLGAGAPPRSWLVVCAPGHPGSTEQAQDAMDAFARGVARAAGWPSESLGAVYFATADSGVRRLEEPDVTLALVTLPFYAEFGRRLGLVPRLQAVPLADAGEPWVLVAGKGKLSGPGSLEGWEVTGRSGYAEKLVRGLIEDGWGKLPESAKITFTARALSALRRSASGEPVAVLLDGEQGAALSGLPFASDLEVVFRSRQLPSSLLCVVKGRPARERTDELLGALSRLHETDQGAETLGELRLLRFRPLEEGVLERVEREWM